MKRWIGIFSLVMALMLVFGATAAVSAFADDAGRSGTTELTGLVL